MSAKPTSLKRRQFLKTAATATSAMAIPTIVSSTALGLGKSVVPSDRVVVGGIGIGRRGTYDLGCFLEQADVQFVAVCDIKEKQRNAIKNLADIKYDNKDCDTYRDFRELLTRDDIDAVLIATGPNWHCTAASYAARAGKDMYCEKPCTKNISQSLLLADTMRRTGRVFQAGTQRRNLPHFAFACELARTGRLGKLRTIYAHPAGMKTQMSGWVAAEAEPPKDVVDWDMYLGPAAWRPYNEKLLDGFNFEKGGGMVGGGVLEWGSHCVDLCQWAANADSTAPIQYDPPDDKGELVATYADDVKLIIRNDGWLPLGSCPVRFEGDEGWIETGDSGKFVLSSPELLAGRKVEEIGGYPATFHVRDFLDCVKTRSQPKANAEAACYSHITCHAANIAAFLNRTVHFDPVTNEFTDDAEANRLRSEALREPWRI
ncbi:Gfo/Idh/MocA family protein [Novipirellula artificiosorum]|uniref:Putative 4,5-dihydroxyphthalate dehydrogenase n=1 Tax=Novipirellula artificiosorum TaxID=2528016 RepID=A0A5C6DAF1_9BACT|nr:Gfo/Idh/MocA family oxidoreductase [Novipirellula artificiosorum]TWU33698.1 putative 4,5-dihydroxyphthalate dehydrogenase [Novipirellula artificiosorum]